MNENIKIENHSAASAREIMRIAPIVNPDRESKLIRNIFRNNRGITNENCPKSFDELTLAHVDSSLNRSARVAVNSLKKLSDTSEVYSFFKERILEESGLLSRNNYSDDEAKARINAFGAYFVNQLTTYMPTLFVAPTRGLSYMAQPIISYGAGDKEFKIPAYNWESEWIPTEGSPTTNTKPVRVLPVEESVLIKDYRNSINLEFNEQLQMAKAMAGNVGNNLKFDAYAGTFGEIAVKYVALGKSYLLSLDELAWNGRINDNYAIGKHGTALSTTSEINTFSFGDVVTGTTTFKGEGVDANIRRQILSFGAGAVTSTSGGMYTANVLYLDLKTFSQLIYDTMPTMDTNPLQFMVNNNIYDAIIPVPAWNQGSEYDNKVTMIAAYVDPQVFFFNNALPMVQTGVALAGDNIQMKYRMRLSGVTIANKLAMVRCQGNRT